MSYSRFQLHLLGVHALGILLGASQLTVKGIEVNTGIITEVKAGKGEGERELAGKSTVTGIQHMVMKENMTGMAEEKEVDMKALGGHLVSITFSFTNALYFLF